MSGLNIAVNDITSRFSLAAIRRLRHIAEVIKTRLARQLIVTVLALFVGMGTILSAVQANDMVLKMAMAGDAGSSGASGCTACGGNKGDANQANCLPACVQVAHGLVPAPITIPIYVADSPSISSNIPPLGSGGIPDPSPPRLSILG